MKKELKNNTEKIEAMLISTKVINFTHKYNRAPFTYKKIFLIKEEINNLVTELTNILNSPWITLDDDDDDFDIDNEAIKVATNNLYNYLSELPFISLTEKDNIITFKFKLSDTELSDTELSKLNKKRTFYNCGKDIYYTADIAILNYTLIRDHQHYMDVLLTYQDYLKEFVKNKIDDYLIYFDIF